MASLKSVVSDSCIRKRDDENGFATKYGSYPRGVNRCLARVLGTKKRWQVFAGTRTTI